MQSQPNRNPVRDPAGVRIFTVMLHSRSPACMHRSFGCINSESMHHLVAPQQVNAPSKALHVAVCSAMCVYLIQDQHNSNAGTLAVSHVAAWHPDLVCNFIYSIVGWCCWASQSNVAAVSLTDESLRSKILSTDHSQLQ